MVVQPYSKLDEVQDESGDERENLVFGVFDGKDAEEQ